MVTRSSREARCLASALAALMLAGCAQAQTRVASVLTGRGQRGEALEKLYSIIWWAKADETQGVPFKPLELASPDADPATGRVFVATSDGRVHAYDKHGQQLWDYDGHGPFFAGPAFDRGEVFVATSEGKLVALEAATGKWLWEYTAGDALVTVPRVSESLVLVMGASETLYAVERKTGAWKWQYRRDKPGEFTLQGAARPLVVEDKVFAGFADGYAVALTAADGGVIWAKELASGTQFLDVDADPVVDDRGRVYFASFATGIWALEIETGATAWTIDRPGVTSLAINPDNDRLFAGGVGFVGCYATDTALPRWVVKLGKGEYVSGLARAQSLILTATGPGPLLFLDARDGKLRRAFDPGRGVSARPATPSLVDAVVLSNRGYVYNLALDPAEPM